MKAKIDRIDKAKAELTRAREDILKAYFTQIHINYITADERNKSLIINGLEKLLVIKGRGFNGEEAKKVRRDSDLSLKGLGDRIDVAPAYINQLELGKGHPGNPPRGKSTIKYLHWLKEHGYNPFGLSD